MHKEAIIIGGGPAGVAAAIWLKKLGVNAVLLETAEALGGLQRRSPYENLWIPGVQGKTGQDVARALAGHATAVGADIRLGCNPVPVRREADAWGVGDLSAPYLVIATGSRPRAAGFKASAQVAVGPGEPMETLDVADKRVAILGGGDNAFDQARFVRDRGGKVTIFTRNGPRAQTMLREMIADVPVVTGFTADQGAMTVNGQSFDAFGVMFGFEAVVPEGLAPDLDNSYVRVDRFGQTSLPGVYACGEVTDYWHPCVTTAAAHGIQVARQIATQLSK